MTIAKLKEATKAADEFSSGASFKIMLLLQSQGVLVRAINKDADSSYIVSWEQVEQSQVNPLLSAILIVSEALQAETLNAEG